MHYSKSWENPTGWICAEIVRTERNLSLGRYVEVVLDAKQRGLPVKLGLEVDFQPGTEEKITELGLKHRIVTQFTSLVAVDHSRTVGNGAPKKIDQAVDLPEGVSRNALSQLNSLSFKGQGTGGAAYPVAAIGAAAASAAATG